MKTEKLFENGECCLLITKDLQNCMEYGGGVGLYDEGPDGWSPETHYAVNPEGVVFDIETGDEISKPGLFSKNYLRLGLDKALGMYICKLELSGVDDQTIGVADCRIPIHTLDEFGVLKGLEIMLQSLRLDSWIGVQNKIFAGPNEVCVYSLDIHTSEGEITFS